MSSSIYFSALRDRPLSSAEQDALQAIEDRYSIEEQLQVYLSTGVGLNWESFSRFPGRTPGELFWGAVRLPDNTDDAPLLGVEHWAATLAEMRKALSGAEWRVQVEDHELPWVERDGRYDVYG